KGPELYRRWARLCAECPDEVTSIVAYLHAPPMDFVPEHVRLKPGFGLIAAATDPAIGEAAIRELRAFSPPLFHVLGPMPYLALQQMLDPALPHGTRCYLKAHYLDDLSDGVVTALCAAAGRMPPGHSQMITLQMGGAVGRVAEDETAVGGRSAAFLTFSV